MPIRKGQTLCPAGLNLSSIQFQEHGCQFTEIVHPRGHLMTRWVHHGTKPSRKQDYQRCLGGSERGWGQPSEWSITPRVWEQKIHLHEALSAPIWAGVHPVHGQWEGKLWTAMSLPGSPACHCLLLRTNTTRGIQPFPTAWRTGCPAPPRSDRGVGGSEHSRVQEPSGLAALLIPQSCVHSAPTTIYIEPQESRPCHCR